MAKNFIPPPWIIDQNKPYPQPVNPYPQNGNPTTTAHTVKKKKKKKKPQKAPTPAPVIVKKVVPPSPPKQPKPPVKKPKPAKKPHNHTPTYSFTQHNCGYSATMKIMITKGLVENKHMLGLLKKEVYCFNLKLESNHKVKGAKFFYSKGGSNNQFFVSRDVIEGGKNIELSGNFKRGNTLRITCLCSLSTGKIGQSKKLKIVGDIPIL